MRGTSGRGSSDDDDVVLFFIALIGGPGLLAAFWSTAVGWLLEHRWLLPEADTPLLIVPATGGAGLDLPRAVIAAAVALAVGAAVCSWAWRLAARRRAARDELGS